MTDDDLERELDDLPAEPIRAAFDYGREEDLFARARHEWDDLTLRRRALLAKVQARLAEYDDWADAQRQDVQAELLRNLRCTKDAKRRRELIQAAERRLWKLTKPSDRWYHRLVQLTGRGATPLRISRELGLIDFYIDLPFDFNVFPGDRRHEDLESGIDRAAALGVRPARQRLRLGYRGSIRSYQTRVDNGLPTHPTGIVRKAVPNKRRSWRKTTVSPNAAYVVTIARAHPIAHQAVIKELLPRQFEVFKLVYIEDMTQREAAAALGIKQQRVNDAMRQIERRFAAAGLPKPLPWSA